MFESVAVRLAACLFLLATGVQASEPEDPYLWLEEVTDERALEWVKERNAVTQARFDEDPEFVSRRDDLLAILDSDDRIPFVGKIGSHYYNFWRDADNERGLWRRTTPEEYAKSAPRWETLIDLDALGAAEGENWVWRGANCLRPEYVRCLVALSRGGADATVTREFDLEKREFVEGGFYRPEAKGGLRWIDRDTVYVYTDFGEGSLTTSGYPRLVKRWQRGTPLEEATLIYEGEAEDMSIAAYRDHTPGFVRDFVSRTIAFYNSELYLLGDDDELTRIEVPNSAKTSVHREYLAVELREPWEVGETTYPAGALLATRLEDFLEGGRELQVLFEPSERTSLAGYSATRDHLFMNVLEDVKNRIYVASPETDGEGALRWERQPLAGMPAIGTVNVRPIDPVESNAYFMTSTDYVTPTTLYQGVVGERPARLKELPAFFDAEGLAISQHFTESEDGTRVPYFMVAPESIELDGANPTLLYGYGGFEESLTPSYNATVGRGWLAEGGVYAVANIRGGGEYGPAWHQAALKKNRMRAYEDFAAVARDLIDRQVTTPERLGILGVSNGGLLVGNMLTHYPELFSAAVCAVPLLDMRRYNQLLAGASWMAEYGDPDDPEQWAFIRAFSPYHNVDSEADYPAVLFTTSTRDDRVHPGHARKMVALMSEQGHDVLYYENIEGGHGGAATNAQDAYMRALWYGFLKERLFASEEVPVEAVAP